MKITVDMFVCFLVLSLGRGPGNFTLLLGTPPEVGCSLSRSSLNFLATFRIFVYQPKERWGGLCPIFSAFGLSYISHE